MQDHDSDEIPLVAQVSALDAKPKRGRPTMPGNFLLGARGQWVSLLEQTWPEIGWQLVRIRKHRKSTIEDIRKAFEPLRAHLHNAGLAARFYRESFEAASSADIRKNRARLGELSPEIHHLQTKRDEQQRSCWEVDDALKHAEPGDRMRIQNEAKRRYGRLMQLTQNLEEAEGEQRRLSEKTLDQEAGFSRSEVLDFLLSGRYAVSPRNLANAIAGLPQMKWRQSFVRCSDLSLYYAPAQEYCVFEALERIWNRRPRDFRRAPIEFFEIELRKLPKKLGHTRKFLWDHWRDLQRAIKECWASKPNSESIPFILTSIFMRNARQQKNSLERVLAELDKLKP